MWVHVKVPLAMRNFTTFLLFLVIVQAAWSQASKDKPNSELGPATSPTNAEAADAAKSPVNLTPVPTAAPVDPKSYIIGPQDILLIRVWREPELSSGVQIRPDGKFTMPLIGEVQAEGLTPDQLSAQVTEALSKFINKPEVTISLQSVLSKKYHITGEVTRSGTFPLVVPVTVMEALSNAGGFREFSNTGKIVIMRGDKRIKFNYREVVKGKNLKQNILLENGDHIFVP